MKKMKTLIAVLVSILLLAHPVFAASAENAGAEQKVEGVYGLFAVTFEGYIVEADEMSSVLGIYEDGTGFLTINNSGSRVEEWSISGEELSIKVEEGTMSGTLTDGIIALNYKNGSTLYYAQEGTDTSSVPVMTKEEFTEAWGKARSEDPVKAMAGAYRMTGGFYDGKEVTEETLNILETMGMSVRLYLNEDGTARLEFMGEVTEGTWDPEKVTVDGEEIGIHFENGVITFSLGEEYMTFVKMTDEAAKAEEETPEGGEGTDAAPAEDDQAVEGGEGTDAAPAEDGQTAEGTEGTEDAQAEAPAYNPDTRAGYYKLVATEDNGTVADASGFNLFGLEMYVVLNEDGSGRMCLFGVDMNLTWDDDNLTFYGEPTPYEYDAGRITLESAGSKLTFEYAGTPEEAPQSLFGAIG